MFRLLRPRPYKPLTSVQFDEPLPDVDADTLKLARILEETIGSDPRKESSLSGVTARDLGGFTHSPAITCSRVSSPSELRRRAIERSLRNFSGVRSCSR